jgi:hypothetical protein
MTNVFVATPSSAARGARRAGKEWRAFRAVHTEDITILKASEYERCLAMRDACRGRSRQTRDVRPEERAQGAHHALGL